MIIIRRYHPFKTEEKTLNENWIFLQKFNPHIFDMNQKIYIYFFTFLQMHAMPDFENIMM